MFAVMKIPVGVLEHQTIAKAKRGVLQGKDRRFNLSFESHAAVCPNSARVPSSLQIKMADGVQLGYPRFEVTFFTY